MDSFLTKAKKLFLIFIVSNASAIGLDLLILLFMRMTKFVDAEGVTTGFLVLLIGGVIAIIETIICFKLIHESVLGKTIYAVLLLIFSVFLYLKIISLIIARFI